MQFYVFTNYSTLRLLRCCKFSAASSTTKHLFRQVAMVKRQTDIVVGALNRQQPETLAPAELSHPSKKIHFLDWEILFINRPYVSGSQPHWNGLYEKECHYLRHGQSVFPSVMRHERRATLITLMNERGAQEQQPNPAQTRPLLVQRFPGIAIGL